MSFDVALRLTEILLAIAFLQQSVEHLRASKDEQRLFLPRIILSLLLLIGWQTPWISLLLFLHAIMVLRRFRGAYNGGSDRMSLLILASLVLIHFMPTLREYVLGYLALQLMMSYSIAGFYKIINPQWRSGEAVQDIFRYSIYPAAETLRTLANRPKLLCLMSWLIILFELLFPLIILNQTILIIGLFLALSFHLANLCLFGLNRFFWAWLAAYPSLLWLQGYLLGG